VPANERFVARAGRLADEAVRRMGEEIRLARVARGLSQEDAGRPVGMSRSKVGRIERREPPPASVRDVVMLSAALGLEVSIRAYPVGPPHRDRAHAGLLERFRSRIDTGWRWGTEVPLPNPGDLRAWDALISRPGLRIGVDAETRARDGQELERRFALKERDGGVDHVIMLLSDTRANRSFVRERAASLSARFPIAGSAARRALTEGRDPGGNAVILT
jgi:transcriptional regulator with XRE-family HTH domain